MAAADESAPELSALSAQELVDVIDDAGNTIAVVPRAQMRGQRLAHRCVYVLVFNGAGQLFIHLRTPTKDVYPSYWDPCIGGVLLAGESYAQAGATWWLESLHDRRAPFDELLARVSAGP